MSQRTFFFEGEGRLETFKKRTHNSILVAFSSGNFHSDGLTILKIRNVPRTLTVYYPKAEEVRVVEKDVIVYLCRINHELLITFLCALGEMVKLFIAVTRNEFRSRKFFPIAVGFLLLHTFSNAHKN